MHEQKGRSDCRTLSPEKEKHAAIIDPAQTMYCSSSNDDNTDHKLTFISAFHTCCPIPLAYGPVSAAVSPRQAIPQANTLMYFTAAFLPTATPYTKVASPTRYVPYASAPQYREVCQALRRGCYSIRRFPEYCFVGEKRNGTGLKFPLRQGAASGSCSN